jgi:Flp pilus assembly protein TadD
LKIALMQFATNAVGKVSSVFESILSLYFINALEKAAGFDVMDLIPTPPEGEMLSLTQVLSDGEVREVAERVGADVSIWGNLRFRPEGEAVINSLQITMLVARNDSESPLESRNFEFDALLGDVRTSSLSIEMLALEDLVEEMLKAVGEILGLQDGDLRLNRIGVGLSHSDRATVYFIYALRITADPEAKLRLYLKALTADPSFALAYTNAAQLLLGEGRYGEAMRLLLRAEANLKGSEIEPDVLNLLGVATMHMGMWDEAVNVWRRALDIQPDNVEAICNIASAYSMRELPDEAEEYYHRALSCRDDYPLAWFALGRLLAREGKYEEAEESIRRYIQLCPGDPWAYYILGISLANMGQEDEAEFALAKSTQLDPDGEAGTLARQELQRLKD